MYTIYVMRTSQGLLPEGMITIEVYAGSYLGYLHEVHEYRTAGELARIIDMLTDNAYSEECISFRVRVCQ